MPAARYKAPSGSAACAASGRRRELSTPTRLRRLLGAVLAATVLSWIAVDIPQLFFELAASVNQQVPPGDYPDPVSHALAEDLRKATDIRFDASDSMPQTMQNAFFNAVLEYLDTPGQLTAILHGLDQVRESAY